MIGREEQTHERCLDSRVEGRNRVKLMIDDQKSRLLGLVGSQQKHSLRRVLKTYYIDQIVRLDYRFSCFEIESLKNFLPCSKD
jgi:hypothetical protein